MNAIITARDLDSCAAFEGAVDARILIDGMTVGCATLATESGRLATYGTSIDQWADAELIRWLDAQDDLREAISDVVDAVSAAL